MKYLRPDSSHSITSTHAGVIDVHVFEPKFGARSSPTSVRGTIVTVHPWSALGGGEHNTVGIARHITASTKTNQKGEHGWRVVTFTLKSSGAVWGILSAHSHEVQQTVDVLNWVNDKYGSDSHTILLGLSAGAPIASSAMVKVEKQGRALSAYIAVGYTFGNFASLGFGRHFSSVVESSLPRLFIMGENDEFTTVNQLEKMTRKMTAGRADVEIVAGVGHFKLESSNYDPLVAKTVVDWLDKDDMLAGFC